ncbi:MAG: hypothetical protein HXY50_10460 [Ignavibacteriaceae bacterium]|nr:hypothetical protein [Ignavibacteriaceae bacterium]
MPSFSHSWLPFIYLYAFGGFFFLAGLIIVQKAKALVPHRKSHKKWRRVLIFGLIYFMLFHTIWIIAAIYW